MPARNIRPRRMCRASSVNRREVEEVYELIRSRVLSWRRARPRIARARTMWHRIGHAIISTTPWAPPPIRLNGVHELSGGGQNIKEKPPFSAQPVAARLSL